jgi:hypothetical protein
MTTATLQQLLVTLLETGRAIAAEPDDPMHGALSAASDIESVAPQGDAGITITTNGGRRLRISVTEAP